MPTNFDDVNAQCPYFRYSEKKKITCEGIITGCNTKIEFATKELRNTHRRIFCNSKYRNCEIYRMLNGKYEE